MEKERKERESFFLLKDNALSLCTQGSPARAEVVC